MIKPRNQKLALMSLGSSIGTNGSLQAEVIVVKDFDELDQKADEVCKPENILMTIKEKF